LLLTFVEVLGITNSLRAEQFAPLNALRSVTGHKMTPTDVASAMF
jgi:hypothetical protein